MLQEILLQYVMKNYNKGKDPVPLNKILEEVNLDGSEPNEPTATTLGSIKVQPTEGEVRKYDTLYKRYLDRINKLEDNTKKLNSLIRRQCTDALKAALKGLDDFESKDDDFDTQWLLQQIKLLSSGSNNECMWISLKIWMSNLQL